MSLFTAQLYPHQGLGNIFALGASLHAVLTRIKAEPQRFPKIDLTYEPNEALSKPVIVGLPANGIRLQFDGAEQRLRLIEIVDFNKNHIIYKEQNKDRDLVKPPQAGEPPNTTPGPTFKHIYSRFLGPTYNGEFIPGPGNSDAGIYVLSYPGVAFTFPLAKSAFSPDKDVVELLSNTQVASSMAIFSGDSWAQARANLWTEVLPSINFYPPLVKTKDVIPDEVSLLKIHGGGKLELFRNWTDTSFMIYLGETTPQELVSQLGPPDQIYRKNDHRMDIHKTRTASNSRTRPARHELTRPDDLTDTDQSSAVTGEESNGDEEAVEDDVVGTLSGECFYNYFHLGFDILVSTPVEKSRLPPGYEPAQNGEEPRTTTAPAPDELVATKVIMHGNIPGSYPFNRHRRCRWEVSYLTGDDSSPIKSEAPWFQIEKSLQTVWRPIYKSDEEVRTAQRGMTLNRGWGDSPGSSVELLGGWEGDAAAKPSESTTSTLYGYPGLVFEVWKGLVQALTIF